MPRITAREDYCDRLTDYVHEVESWGMDPDGPLNEAEVVGILLERLAHVHTHWRDIRDWEARHALRLIHRDDSIRRIAGRGHVRLVKE